MEYSSYLQTSHWQKTRKKLILQKGNICKFCESREHINIHHKVYKDKFGKSILFHERNHQLIPLCASCHKYWHQIHGLREIKPMDHVRGKLLLKLGATKKQAIYLSTERTLGIELLKKKLELQIPFPRWGNSTCNPSVEEL